MDSPDYFALKSGTPSKEAEALAKLLIADIYHRIVVVIKTYMDITEENAELIALWIIGTHLHKDLPSFPRLYINAMKGSGKSRLLQILKALCWNATLQANLTEAVLFRSAAKTTLLFDESESLSTKEKGALRELLNAGYKKGVQVKRMRKSFSKEGEQQVIESFDLYGPVALANINGIEDVLGDRCISVILEKSKDPSKIKLIEDFDTNPLILDLKRALSVVLVYKCSVVYMLENVYGMSKYNIYTLSTLTTQTTQTALTTQNLYNLKPILSEVSEDLFKLSKEEIEFFDSMKDVQIDGRNLELFFPLFIIAKSISDEVFNRFKTIAKEMVFEKVKEDQIENTDWSLIDFIARQPQTLKFVQVSEILRGFKEFYAADDTQWINSHWIGRALKRLGLYLDKRRVGKGTEYMLDVNKAIEKLNLFRGESQEKKVALT